MSKFVLQGGPATEVLQSQEYLSTLTIEGLMTTIQGLTDQLTALAGQVTTLGQTQTDQGTAITTLNSAVASISAADQNVASEIAALTQAQTDQGTAITGLNTKLADHKAAFNILGTYAIQGSLNTADVVKNVLKLEHPLTQQVETSLTGQLQHNVLQSAVTTFTPSAGVFDTMIGDMTQVLDAM